MIDNIYVTIHHYSNERWHQTGYLCHMDTAVNLSEKFHQITSHWDPKIIAELNGQHVKLAKIKGDFVMHKHDSEDELFLVIKGRFRMEYEKDSEWINEGELVVVPKGVMHRPVAEEEAWILLFEPATTLNTGDRPDSEFTKTDLEKI